MKKCLIIILFLSFVASCQKFQSMSGFVFDYDTGKPVKGALVKFYSDGKSSHSKNDYKADITDDKGCYKIELRGKSEPAADKFYIEVRKEGYITLYDTFSIAKDNKLSIYLKEAAREL